jgi:uncharacterized protein (DUF4415 family)
MIKKAVSKKVVVDAEMLEFEKALLRSLDQAMSGKQGRVHTPEAIAARRPGRPVGSTQAHTKRSTTLRLDEEILERWRATGKGWQTRAAEVLTAHAP